MSLEEKLSSLTIESHEDIDKCLKRNDPLSLIQNPMIFREIQLPPKIVDPSFNSDSSPPETNSSTDSSSSSSPSSFSFSSSSSSSSSSSPPAAVGYTDCVECSFLSFLHLVFTDFSRPKNEDGSTHFNVERFKSVCPLKEFVEFFETNPTIHPPSYYDDPNPGYKARSEWAALVTRLPAPLTYSRTTQDELYDDFITEGKTLPPLTDFLFELHTTMLNVVAFFAHLFPSLKRILPPVELIEEDLDDTSHYMPYFNCFSTFLNEQEELKKRKINFSLCVGERYHFGGDSEWFANTPIEILLNGEEIWCWKITRQGVKGFSLSCHSHISPYVT